MGFIPDQLDWTYLQPPPQRVVESACHFCAARPNELYQLPTFGLAGANEPIALACADCYQQVTFTAPRLAARVIFDFDAA
jgi:hypothetical protein